MPDNYHGGLRSWACLTEGRFVVFAWVESPDGVLFHANFDDGYLYAQANNYRYGPGTLGMRSVDATGWKIVDGPT